MWYLQFHVLCDKILLSLWFISQCPPFVLCATGRSHLHYIRMELFFQYHIGISLFLNPQTIWGFSKYKKSADSSALFCERNPFAQGKPRFSAAQPYLPIPWLARKEWMRGIHFFVCPWKCRAERKSRRTAQRRRRVVFHITGKWFVSTNHFS